MVSEHPYRSDMQGWLQQSKKLPANAQGSQKIDFKGKTVMITGAGAGLGRSYALMFAKLGANIVVNDVSKEGAGKVVDEIRARELRPSLSVVQADHSRRKGSCGCMLRRRRRCYCQSWSRRFRYGTCPHRQRRDFTRQVVPEHGRKDVGSSDFCPPEGYLQGDPRVLRCVRGFMSSAPKLAGRFSKSKSTEGSLLPLRPTVFVSQVPERLLTIDGTVGQANYSTAKAAIIGLTRTLAIEGGRAGIQANCMAPRAGTAMTATVWPK